MINQVWLKTFCTLVEVGHFTKSAELLFMTQSGVSQHIKKLETQLNTALISREGKSFSLTDAGKKLYQQGSELLGLFEQLSQEIKGDHANKGTIKMSSPGSIGLSLYPYLLDYQRQNPELAIDYTFAPNHSIEQNIANGMIDVGLMSEYSKLDNIICQNFTEDNLVLVTPKANTTATWHTLVSLGFISHPDAKHHAQLLLTENFSEFNHIDQFPRHGFSNQISLILEPVSRGLGFTVLPRQAALAFNKQNAICIHTLATPVNETLYLCFHQNKPLPARVKALVTTIARFCHSAFQFEN